MTYRDGSASARLATLLCGAALAWSAVAGAAAAAPSPVVRTQEGPVQGVETDGVRAFTAIPYAAPPVGPLRFRAPQPVARWTDTFVADKQMPTCIQFGGNSAAPQTEDCLYLSVWIPATATAAKPVPVMVWIYGGGEITGSARNFDGAGLARNGVAVVTLNYRLGVLGTMVHHSLDEPGVLSGNMALRDEQAALRWVQRNIGAFGGDPKNVTLFGQSGGAGAVLKQLASPAAKGLFHKIIAMSSTGAGGGAASRREDIEAGSSAALIKAVGCEGKADIAACLRSVTPAALVAAGKDEPYRHAVLDPTLLPKKLEDAFKAGEFNRVPVLIGTNMHEAVFWVLPLERELGHAARAEDFLPLGRRLMGDQAEKVLSSYPIEKYPSVDFALMQAVTDWRQACPNDGARRSISAFVPVYAIENAVPKPNQTAPDPAYSQLPNTPRHASENAYVWGSRRGAEGPTSEDILLTARLQRYWSNFAKFSTPDPTKTEWPAFTVAQPKVLNFMEPPVVAADFSERHNCAFLRANNLATD